MWDWADGCVSVLRVDTTVMILQFSWRRLAILKRRVCTFYEDNFTSVNDSDKLSLLGKLPCRRPWHNNQGSYRMAEHVRQASVSTALT